MSFTKRWAVHSTEVSSQATDLSHFEEEYCFSFSPLWNYQVYPFHLQSSSDMNKKFQSFAPPPPSYDGRKTSKAKVSLWVSLCLLARKRMRYYHVLEGLSHSPLDICPFQLQHDQEGQEHREAGHSSRPKDGYEQHLPPSKVCGCCAGEQRWSSWIRLGDGPRPSAGKDSAMERKPPSPACFLWYTQLF